MTWLLVIGVVMFIGMLCIGTAIANDERKRIDRIYDYDPMNPYKLGDAEREKQKKIRGAKNE